MEEKEKSDIKFAEKFSLKIRKTFIVSKMLTILLVVILVCAFIGLNVVVNNVDLPEIDVTANQIYTLSDISKKELETINQDTKIYLFGIEESESVVGLVKQYCDANPKISYEMLSKESNMEKVQEFELEDNYKIVVIESEGSHKIIDTSSEFTTYDNVSRKQIDTTEQTLTNSIISLGTANKPKVYFVEGHGEFSPDKELNVLKTYLQNEAYEVEKTNIMTSGVPEDCDVLAIVSPSSDFFENEVNAVTDYINKGGNLFVTQDIIEAGTTFENLQKILDVYGVSIDNGYILETDSKRSSPNYPYIFIPQISTSNKITSDIASDDMLWLAYSKKLSIKSDEELKALNVTPEILLETSDNAMFVTDFSSNLANVASSAQNGKFTISSMMTKVVKGVKADGTEVSPSEIPEEEEKIDTGFPEEENEGEEKKEEEKIEKVESKLVVVATGRFFADFVVSELSSQYPLSYLVSNKDFAINSIATLAKKENGLTIRKDMAGTSYVFSATQSQNTVVLIIIFTIPVVIIIAGIVVWKVRKRRK